MLIGEWLIGMIRIIAFLMAVMYGGTAAAESPDALHLAQTARRGEPARLNDSGRDAQNSHLTAGVSSDGVAQKPSIAFGSAPNDPNSLSSTSTGAGTRELFFKMMLSVLLVVGLGAAAIYASRRLVGRITNPPGKRIKVVATG